MKACHTPLNTYLGPGGRLGHRRRGVILPVMLMILVLLGLLAASFAFRVHADRSAMNAVEYRMHTRLAAEAGIQKALLMLRTERHNVQAWYSNPEELNRIIVWTPKDDSIWGTNEELEEDAYAYRFSLVADNPFDDEDRCRFGITDESAKLNINTASRGQLRRLIARVATADDMIVDELVDALLDWRDQDDKPGEFGAESQYYASLATPYRPKNGLFDTVEELLMVKGFDGRVLYGEDQDRNGIMTPNEDDGQESFPEDDGDGQLNRGLYPYITVLSWQTDTDRYDRPRVYLHGDSNALSDQLSEFIDDPAKVQFIVGAMANPGGQGDGGSEGGDEEAAEDDVGDDAGDEDGDTANGEVDRDQEQPDAPHRGRRGSDADKEEDVRRSQPISRDAGEDDPSADQDRADEETGDEDSQEGEQEGHGGQEDGGGGEGATSQPSRLNSPADLLTADVGGSNPLTIEDLPVLMERTTTRDPLMRQEGLINVMTAPPQVLGCILELSDEQISAMAAARGELSDDEQASTAWLVTRDILSLETYQQVAPQITAAGMQFTIESVGYADHVGTVTRLQVIVEMRGPMAQVLYYRDLTSLGAVFPIREGEEEYGFGGRRG